MKLKNFITTLLLFVTLGLSAQTIDVNNMTKEQVIELTYDQLLDLPFEDLLKLADIIGVSTDELLQMAMDRQLSTASKREESLFDSPLSTSVISKEDIALSGATSIPELFRGVPGMIVREKSNGNYDVHIRGLDNLPPDNVSHFSQNTLTLVMIDNVPFYNYANGGTFWETLPISLVEIERIDIIRGPSSSLYGPNAVSGVINIITKKQGADENLNAQANASYGMFNTLNAEASVGSKIAKGLSFRIGGSYEQRDRTEKDYFCYATNTRLSKNIAYSVFNAGTKDPYFDKNFQFDDFNSAAKKYSANGNLFYNHNDLSVSLTGAFQSSEAQTIFMETYAIPFTIRESQTFNSRLSVKWKGLSINASNVNGMQDMSKHVNWPLVKYDINNTYANIDYSHTFLDKFTITPSFNFQMAQYNPESYNDDLEKAKALHPTLNIGGLFKESSDLQTYGGALRLDYNPIENLRLVAALRLDKYNYPDKKYLSYQFVGSYKINDKHLIRGVYSRANRGSFMANTYIDYKNQLMYAKSVDPSDENPDVAKLGQLYQLLIGIGAINENDRMYEQYYRGNKELKLLTMDMLELGYRAKISDRLQADFELFYSTTQNFDAIIPQTPSDQIKYTEKWIKHPMIKPLTGMDSVPLIRFKEELKYENLDLKAYQMGLSYSINYMPINKLFINFYGTIQKTDLKDHVDLDGKKVDIENKWTPSFYGGLTLNYTPIEKLSVNANVSFATKQEFHRYKSPLKVPTETGYDEIDARALLNLTVSYKVWGEHVVYLSGRNISNGKREFGFGDPVKPMVIGGVRLNF